jgi:hypothetical protein
MKLSKEGYAGLQYLCYNIQSVPLATEPGWLADRCSVSQQLGALQTHTTDTFLFISHTTNVPLFKLRCNIFVGVRIIKEMPGSVASGTPYIIASKTNDKEMNIHGTIEKDMKCCSHKIMIKAFCK